jgi:glycosyltransferase involved in cell wall biosynthesis
VKILLATDAWLPQVNGVVRTLTALMRELTELSHTVTVMHPGQFPGFACPGYPEIRLAVALRGRVARLIEDEGPDAIHIVTEGPIGFAVRRWCIKKGGKFTTAYHTRFPEYLAGRHLAPAGLTYSLLRQFHRPSTGVMVATPSIARELAERGFDRLRPWTRGVDSGIFSPERRIEDFGFPRPIFLNVGRIAPEKNLPAFLSLDLPGSKVVIGEGPQLPELRRRFPDVHFLGRRENGKLAAIYASADAFVFPSQTDTFGLVMLEALASGLPVAAFPVPGPIDVIGKSGAGVLHEDLRTAALAALHISRLHCREYAMSFSWQNCATQFVEHLCPLH